MATEEPSANESCQDQQRSQQNGNARRTVHSGNTMPANTELLHERRMCGPAHVVTEQPLDFSISRRSLTPSPPSPVHDQHHLDHATHSPAAVIASSPPARSPSPRPPQQQQQHPYPQPHSHPHQPFHEDRYTGDAATSTTSEPEPMPVRIPSPISAPIPSQGFRGPGAFGAFGFSLGSVGVTAGMIAMNEAFNQSNFFSSLPPLSLSMLQQANCSNNSSADNGRKAPKAVRPFKAYPRDPLSLPLGYYGLPGHYGMPVDGVMPSSLIMNDSYADYRRQMLLGQHDKDFPSSMVPSANLHHNGGDALKAIHRCPPSSPAISSDNSLSPPPPMSNTGLPPALLPTPLPHAPSLRSNSPSLSPSPGITPDTPNSNSSSSKRRQRSLPDDLKDEAYWERRRKNNEAAKRSRDARRAKEDEIAIRAAFLEQENLKLRVEVAALKNETAKLRCLLYNS